MKIELKDFAKKLTEFANVVQAKAMRYIRANAYDTGDLERSIVVSEVTENNGIYEISVFSDPTKLYNRRPKMKGSTDLYPIYVHQGTKGWSGTVRRKYVDFTLTIPPMKARPYLTIAFEQTRPLFKDIMPTIKVENDNK